MTTQNSTFKKYINIQLHIKTISNNDTMLTFLYFYYTNTLGNTGKVVRLLTIQFAQQFVNESRYSIEKREERGAV